MSRRVSESRALSVNYLKLGEGKRFLQHLHQEGFQPTNPLSALFFFLTFYLNFSHHHHRHHHHHHPQHCSLITELVTLVAVQTLLAIASATELIQTPWLGDLKAYHDIVFYSFKVGCLVMLSCRLVLGVFIQVPDPIPARLTFLWQAWHLLRHTYDQAVLQAHQTYGPSQSDH